MCLVRTENSPVGATLKKLEGCMNARSHFLLLDSDNILHGCRTLMTGSRVALRNLDVIAGGKGDIHKTATIICTGVLM
jgi:hypothetical protein